MTKWICVGLLILFVSGCSSLQFKVDKVLEAKMEKGKIYFIYNGKVLQAMTPTQWKALVDTADKKNKLDNAEGAKRVRIFLHNDPWVIPFNKRTFKTKATIKWFNKDGKELKKMTIKIIMQKGEGSYTSMKILEVYDSIARVGFPIMSVISAILLALLLIL